MNQTCLADRQAIAGTAIRHLVPNMKQLRVLVVGLVVTAFLAGSGCREDTNSEKLGVVGQSNTSSEVTVDPRNPDVGSATEEGIIATP